MTAPNANRLPASGRPSDLVSSYISSPCSLAVDASPSDPEVLRTLYAAMLRTRLLEEQVLGLLRAGRIPGVAAPVLGGEATEVGACIGLHPGDTYSSSQPKLATEVVVGTPLEKVLAQLRLAKAPPAAEPSVSLHVLPATATLAGQLDLAAGVAFAYRFFAKPNVVVTLAHDGLAALGFWHEAASLASRHRLPIVFMVENCVQSQCDGASPFYTDEDLRDRAEAYGIPGITVDGNDIVAVWRVTQESIHRARTGAGPTLVECRTWRWHAEADKNASNGHSASKLRRQNDPLHHMEHYMRKRKLWRQSWSDQLRAEYRSALDAALRSREGPQRRATRQQSS